MPDDTRREKIAAKVVDILNGVRQADGYFFDLNAGRKRKFLKDVEDSLLPDFFVIGGPEARDESEYPFATVTLTLAIMGYVKASETWDKDGTPGPETLRNRALRDIETALYSAAYPGNDQGGTFGMEQDGVIGMLITKVTTDEGEIAPYAFLGVLVDVRFRYPLGQP